MPHVSPVHLASVSIQGSFLFLGILTSVQPGQNVPWLCGFSWLVPWPPDSRSAWLQCCPSLERALRYRVLPPSPVRLGNRCSHAGQHGSPRSPCDRRDPLCFSVSVSSSAGSRTKEEGSHCTSVRWKQKFDFGSKDSDISEG